MNGFYPAIHVWNYENASAALKSIGIVGEEAEFCLSGMDDDRTQPHVFEVVVTLQGEPCKSAVVLLELANGLTGLWFGLFAHLKDTAEGALVSMLDEWAVEDEPEPPTISIFEWTQPMRSLQ